MVSASISHENKSRDDLKKKRIAMAIKERSEERKEHFKAMSSDERKALIRKKMNDEGLKEGSEVPGKDLSSYDRDEIWDLIK